MHELEVQVYVNKWYEYLVLIQSHVLVASVRKQVLQGSTKLSLALSLTNEVSMCVPDVYTYLG